MHSNEYTYDKHFKLIQDLYNKYLPNNNQFFYLGYILLSCASSHIKEFKSIEYLLQNSEILISKKCCLYHLLIYIEKTNINLKQNKIKISNFINNKLYSDNFINFLCNTLSFDNNKTQIYNHPWIKVSNYVQLNNNINKVRVSMKEIIKISGSLMKSITNEKKYFHFLNNFEIILSNNRSIKREDIINLMINKKYVIKQLSQEFGINTEELIYTLSKV